MQNEVNVGRGYRRLNPGETIQQSDEVYIAGYWQDTGDAGRMLRNSWDHPYRRAVEIDAGIQLNANQTARLMAILNWTVNTSGVSASSRALRDELFLVSPVETAPQPKKYRLLSVGEIERPGDEYYSSMTWKNVEKESVVTRCQYPVRREIDSYTGGPA